MSISIFEKEIKTNLSDYPEFDDTLIKMAGLDRKEIIKKESGSLSKIKVSISANWATVDTLFSIWGKMAKKVTESGLEWNNIILVKDGKDADYHVIINKPLLESKVPENKTIVFTMEPDCEWANHWTNWYSSRKNFLRFCNHGRYFNNNEWHLGSNWSKLSTNSDELFLGKKDGFSTVVSSLYEMDGHKKRIDFMKHVEKNWSSLGCQGPLDIFGRDNKHEFKNYRGSLVSHNKDLGLFPYKYTFISENCELENYFTEKIIDPILAETLCFYWGCPNLSDFIDPQAFIVLDLEDFDASLKIIKSSIENNEWEKRLPIIRKEKKKLLDHYSFFPRIEGIIQMDKINIKFHQNLSKNALITERVKKSILTSLDLSEDRLNVEMDSNITLNFPDSVDQISKHFGDFLPIYIRLMIQNKYKFIILSDVEPLKEEIRKKLSTGTFSTDLTIFDKLINKEHVVYLENLNPDSNKTMEANYKIITTFYTEAYL